MNRNGARQFTRGEQRMRRAFPSLPQGGKGFDCGVRVHHATAFLLVAPAAAISSACSCGSISLIWATARVR